MRSSRSGSAAVVRGHYDDTTEDAYYMQFRLDTAEHILSPFASHNRISQYYDAA